MEHKETCGIAFAVVLARIKKFKRNVKTLEVNQRIQKGHANTCSCSTKTTYFELKPYTTIKSKGI